MPTFNDNEWVVLHGDSAESAVWAVLTDHGEPLDLTDWSVNAQARDSADDPTPQFTWLTGDGIDIGTAVVQGPHARRIKTSTVVLYLRPSDFEQFPRRYTGVVDVEIASDGSLTPEERHTIARFPFRVEPDVTRAD